ncbi:uncharacterized protein LOC142325823 isoform X2 [Lycorma delicatula]|uniref:uncharacterized protein LOC142325823 isoform X2 n=1 Tax=Lycorma delicatula TaxID=130591 RepID=UPI003F512C3F
MSLVIDEVTKACGLSEVIVSPHGCDLWCSALNGSLREVVQRLQQQRRSRGHERTCPGRRQIGQIPKFDYKVRGLQYETDNLCRRIKTIPLFQFQMEVSGIKETTRRQMSILRRDDTERLQQIPFSSRRITFCRFQQERPTAERQAINITRFRKMFQFFENGRGFQHRRAQS